MTPLFRVSGTTSVKRLAGAVAKTLRECGQCELQACGAGAVNQAVKALAVARVFLQDDGVYPQIDITFVETTFGDGAERTLLRFSVTGCALEAA